MSCALLMLVSAPPSTFAVSHHHYDAGHRFSPSRAWPPLQRHGLAVPVTAAAPRHRHTMTAARESAPQSASTRMLLPIWLAVLVQMLGVGVTLSTLPVYLTALGGSPAQLALIISVFSACQMVGAPLLVALSNRLGRLTILRACLAGNALAALLTSAASTWQGIAYARALAGLTAASVPIAQISVADVCPPGTATSKALSRIASASSLGIIAGPLMGSAVGELARSTCGAATLVAQSRWVFGASGAFAVVVLCLTSRVRLSSQVAGRGANGDGGRASGLGQAVRASRVPPPPPPPAFAQPLCRWVALICSFSVVTGIATYALFALRFLGYGPRQLSLTQSSAAAVALVVNLFVLPQIIDRVGEAAACSIGLAALGLCLGGCSLLTVQPWHFVVFLLSRVGFAMADTTAAALTARNSAPERRARDLALLQSTQSGSRIFSPLLASWLYTHSISATRTVGPAGTLPFLTCGAAALLTAPLPLLLSRPHLSSPKGVKEERSA